MKKYQGMTLVGMLLTMATVIVAAIVIMRVVPVYLEHYEVVSSMKTLTAIPASEFTADASANANILKSKLLSQLYVNSIESIKPEQIIVTPDGQGNFVVSVKYQVLRPLVANIQLLFDFDASQEVKVSAE
jgi:hypothetical protein